MNVLDPWRLCAGRVNSWRYASAGFRSFRAMIRLATTSPIHPVRTPDSQRIKVGQQLIKRQHADAGNAPIRGGPEHNILRASTMAAALGVAGPS